MKLKMICVWLFMAIISSNAFAQKKLKFNSINMGGIAIGQRETKGVVETINGVNYKKWFAGIGIGYDACHYKTIPLFLDIRRYVDNQNKLFIYADAGYNFPDKNTPGSEVYYYNSFHFTGGIFTDAGIGYKIKFSKNKYFILTAGYSNKKLDNKVVIITCPFIPPCFENIYHYDYSFDRIVLKAGISL